MEGAGRLWKPGGTSVSRFSWLLRFNSPTVERLRLLDGRTTVSAPSVGLTGVTANQADLLWWFDLGGHIFRDLPTLFSTTSQGGAADPWAMGQLGAPILRPFRVVFDYPHARYALEKLER